MDIESSDVGRERALPHDRREEIAPNLSVVVTVVEGDIALARCLEALMAQTEAPAMEVIVPFDTTIAEIGTLADRFPNVRFLDMGEIAGYGPPLSTFACHLLYDRRRTSGLLAARGQLIAILEDRGWPRPTWARDMARLHSRLPHAAIGGAIENGSHGLLQSAVFACDFGRYEPPLASKEANYLSDTNICYKRESLESIRHLWSMRYLEIRVNGALQLASMGLYLSEEPHVVQQRDTIQLGSILDERIHWGRYFSHARGREVPRFVCLLWALGTPCLPGLLLFRYFRRELGKRGRTANILRLGPAILLLLVFWSVGEFIGYCEAAFSPMKDRS